MPQPAPAPGVAQEFVNFFTSLGLTVTLLALSVVLIFSATIDQVNLGIWAVQEKYFRTFVVLWRPSGMDVPLPVFPGGYFIGGLLLINLVGAHLRRFRLAWGQLGIHLTHFGLILLLVGELFTGLFAEESFMTIDEGAATRYLEHSHDRELAIIETTSPEHDSVVAIPTERLAGATKTPITHPRLPFAVHTVAYLPNAHLRMRRDAPDAPASPATAGIGPQVVVEPARLTFKPNEQNLPTAFLDLRLPDGRSAGVWLVSLAFEGMPTPQTFTVGDRTFRLELRAARTYLPFTLQLKDFSHDRYIGTDIPKNFSSLVHLTDPTTGEDRDVLIYMNNPLRHGGHTFYQASFRNNDTTTVLQVVENPSWLLPYVACVMMAFGLLWHFLLHLGRFMRRRSARASATAAPAAA